MGKGFAVIERQAVRMEEILRCLGFFITDRGNKVADHHGEVTDGHVAATWSGLFSMCKNGPQDNQRASTQRNF
jgi:hypothetical protein